MEKETAAASCSSFMAIFHLIGYCVFDRHLHRVAGDRDGGAAVGVDIVHVEPEAVRGDHLAVFGIDPRAGEVITGLIVAHGRGHLGEGF